MMKKRIIIPLVILTVAILLLLPAVFKDKSHPKLVGPDLSELHYLDIHFENRSAGIDLAGMLFLPESNGSFPTAIIIHGSGTSRRNSIWYLSVAEYLQNQGIAVLLPDKRGSEKSGGNWLGASFEELATDTMAAIEYVENQDIYETSTLGLIGMSQGGWIAPIVASKSDKISFVVSISGSIVTTNEQLLYEEENNISPYTYNFIAKLIAPITSSNLMKKKFFTPIAGFDPIPYWKKVDVPVFFTLGGNDKNIPIEKSIKRLNENNLENIKVQVYKDGGHAIRDPHSNEVSKEFLNDLVQFIKSAY